MVWYGMVWHGSNTTLETGLNKAGVARGEDIPGGGGRGPGFLVPNIMFLVFPCSLKIFFRFWCSLFPKIPETQLLFPFP